MTVFFVCFGTTLFSMALGQLADSVSEARVAEGDTVALHYHSPTSYQIRKQIRYLLF
jgi:hypothetical protein